MCDNVCIFCTIKLLTLLFSTPITIISADILCNFCSLLSLFQRSAPFLPPANPGGLQGSNMIEVETKPHTRAGSKKQIKNYRYNLAVNSIKKTILIKNNTLYFT